MKLTLVKKQDEAKDTKSFFFKPEKKINYKTGQYYYFTLPEMHYPDPRDGTRHFTLSSSPTDDENLRITVRMRESSGYKKTLNELPIGTGLEGQGPEGEFYMDKNTTGNHVFLAGGIGVTPFRSMIKFVSDTKLKVNITLIFSNSSEEEIAFKKELEEIASSNSNIKIHFIVTSRDGRIDANMIQKLTQEIENPTFWIAGPPPMVTAMEEALSKLKIPEDQIRSEKFTGY